MANLRKKILVIEDDPDICELLTEFLEGEGYQVTCISSALEALKLLSDRAFHLITLDLNLPDLHGNDFLRQLTRSGKSIPVVVVSANPSDLKPSPLVRKVIPKPFDLFHFAKTIRQLV